MYEHRCRTTSEPVNGTDGVYRWEVYEPYTKLCFLNKNNCPAGTYCGAPYQHEVMKTYKWSAIEELKDVEEFNYGFTNFDNIGYLGTIIRGLSIRSVWCPVFSTPGTVVLI